MLSKIQTVGLAGIDGYAVTAEVDVCRGIERFDLVGFPDSVVKESRERVRLAMLNSGLLFPEGRITVNLAPADIKKEGAMYDLPITVGLLQASGKIAREATENTAFIGELSLDGSVRRINGVLPLIISCLKLGIKRVVVPKENAAEASYVNGIAVCPVASLLGLVDALNTGALPVEPHKEYSPSSIEPDYDLKYVKGQLVVKRALEVAVSGGHNLLMIGPPGAGKTMIAKCIPSVMPDMSVTEALEVTKIFSIAGLLGEEGIVLKRPFRSPHHTATTAALTGGGKNSRPGEISLADRGVLFLDELPEYTRSALEALRQPLEDGKVTVARAAQSVTYPCSFMLVASMNPCPCGYYGSKQKQCRCTYSEIRKYKRKLSGPLLDRIDIHVEVDSVDYCELKDKSYGESSLEVKARVNAVRALQRERYKNDGIFCNAQMHESQLERYCRLSKECDLIMAETFSKLNLSARAYTRILKVARTIADMDGAAEITPAHLYEAVQYRSYDRES